LYFKGFSIFIYLKLIELNAGVGEDEEKVRRRQQNGTSAVRKVVHD